MKLILKKVLVFLSYLLNGVILYFINYKFGGNPDNGLIIGFLVSLSIDFINFKYKKEKSNER